MGMRDQLVFDNASKELDNTITWHDADIIYVEKNNRGRGVHSQEIEVIAECFDMGSFGRCSHDIIFLIYYREQKEGTLWSGREFTAIPVNADGWLEVWHNLQVSRNISVELALAREDVPSSRVMWPRDLIGYPFFKEEYKCPPGPLGWIWYLFGCRSLTREINTQVYAYLFTQGKHAIY